MSVRVRVPTPLRKFTQGVDEVNAQGNNIRSIVEDLERNYPGIKERICDETGGPLPLEQKITTDGITKTIKLGYNPNPTEKKEKK